MAVQTPLAAHQHTSAVSMAAHTSGKHYFSPPKTFKKQHNPKAGFRRPSLNLNALLNGATATITEEEEKEGGGVGESDWQTDRQRHHTDRSGGTARRTHNGGAHTLSVQGSLSKSHAVPHSRIFSCSSASSSTSSSSKNKKKRNSLFSNNLSLSSSSSSSTASSVISTFYFPKFSSKYNAFEPPLSLSSSSHRHHHNQHHYNQSSKEMKLQQEKLVCEIHQELSKTLQMSAKKKRQKELRERCLNDDQPDINMTTTANNYDIDCNNNKISNTVKLTSPTIGCVEQQEEEEDVKRHHFTTFTIVEYASTAAQPHHHTTGHNNGQKPVNTHTNTHANTHTHTSALATLSLFANPTRSSRRSGALSSPPASCSTSSNLPLPPHPQSQTTTAGTTLIQGVGGLGLGNKTESKLSNPIAVPPNLQENSHHPQLELIAAHQSAVAAERESRWLQLMLNRNANAHKHAHNPEETQYYEDPLNFAGPAFRSRLKRLILLQTHSQRDERK